MKKIFKFALVALAVAAVAVACKKPADGPEEPKVDEALIGTWTITGEAQGWNAAGGVTMTESDNVWTVAEVEVKGEGFKFVKDGSWDVNLGAAPVKGTQTFEDDVEFDLSQGGDNIIGTKGDGVYQVTLNLLTKKAKIKFVKALFVPAIKIDGDMSDWADITALTSSQTSRIREWKFKSDAQYVYFYFSLRKNRVNNSKTLYIGFDTDNSDATGSSHGNVPGCEAVAKAVPFTNADGAAPVCVNGADASSTAGEETGVVVCYAYDDGSDLSSDSSNIYLEVSVPRSALGLPAAGTAITIGCSYDWYVTGVKSLTLE